jgi:aryl-alcohol dehydrogenase-like predicted oxidoreductase
MRYRSFGSIDFQVSEIGFGAASISGEGGGYGFGDISEDDAINLVQYGYERGINLFDTAPIYGFGLSEKRLGLALKAIREKVFIISKSGVDWHDTKRVNMTNDPKSAEKMLHQSLRDLKSDYIDLYMVHWPDKNVDIRSTLEVYLKAQIQGKIKHIGLCNTHREDLELALTIAKVEVLQSEYNLFFQNKFDTMLDVIEKHNISLMSWGTFDKGVLTSSVKPNRTYDKSDCRHSAPWWNKNEVDARAIKVEQFVQDRQKELIEGDITIRDIALHFNLTHPRIKCALVGVKKQAHIDSAIASLDKVIKPYIILEAQERLIEVVK